MVEVQQMPIYLVSGGLDSQVGGTGWGAGLFGGTTAGALTTTVKQKH